MNGYFVTGTDTNVGKTYVTCGLARRARERGRHVFAFKPVETGCAMGADGYVGADQDLLAAAAGDWQHGALRGPYRFALPAAPLVAARAENAAIDLDLIVHTAREGALNGPSMLTLVEGAGGWRVPLTSEADMGTLARRLGLPVLVVARAGLGTINHTLLTVEAIRRDEVPIAAVVLSRRPEDDPVFCESNRAEILRRWPGVVLVFDSNPTALDYLIGA
jgi:dethiobiotin synthetase